MLLGGRVLGRFSAQHRTVKVNLKGRTGTVRLRIVMHLRGGRTVTDTRRYHVCSRSAPQLAHSSSTDSPAASMLRCETWRIVSQRFCQHG